MASGSTAVAPASASRDAGHGHRPAGPDGVVDQQHRPVAADAGPSRRAVEQVRGPDARRRRPRSAAGR